MAQHVELDVSSLGVQKKRVGIYDFFIRMAREKPLGTVGAVIVLALILIAIFADMLAPYGVNETHLADCLTEPSSNYLLGTDNLGRDLLSRIIFGARISIYVGLGGAILNALVASAIGLTCGFVGGKLDTAIQRFVDAWMCFPGLILFLSIMALVGPGLVQILLVLGISAGIRNSRIVRGAVMSIRENVYVTAAQTIGCSNTRTIIKHVLPNVAAPIIIIVSISCGQMILVEASLSFLGFGIPPPIPSWGGMLSGSGRTYMFMAPWMALWPGVALAITVWGLNVFGDAVRDLLDPRLRGGVGRYGGVKVKKIMDKKSNRG